MAETLTIDTTPDTETLTDQLTPEEQDSLEVGEKIVEEQEQLLAGKYKNSEELEKAYKELEAKLGDKEETTDTDTEEESKEVDFSPAATLITDASQEFSDKGELTAETMAKFSEMSSADLVNAYVEIQSQLGEQEEAAPTVDLSDADVNTVINYAGCEQAYQELTSWASANLDQSASDAFDSIVNSGSVEAIKLAVAGIKAQYDESNGYEGRMLSGKAPQTSGDVFRSQAEVVSAMNDPRYDNDPAYRQDLIEKLDRSDVQF